MHDEPVEQVVRSKFDKGLRDNPREHGAADDDPPRVVDADADPRINELRLPDGHTP